MGAHTAFSGEYQEFMTHYSIPKNTWCIPHFSQIAWGEPDAFEDARQNSSLTLRFDSADYLSDVYGKIMTVHDKIISRARDLCMWE